MAWAGSLWDGLPADPDGAWALVSQERLPALSARAQVATTQAQARRSYFTGEATLELAFPHLAAAGLRDRVVLRGRLAAIDVAAAKRAGERVARAPKLGSARRRELSQRALSAALDAEDQAAGLERRLLLGLVAQLDAHPSLERRALAQGAARLERALERARIRASSDDPAESTVGAERAAALDQERVRRASLLRALQRLATVPGAAVPDPSQDLTRLSQGQGAQWALERLQLLQPFLGRRGARQVVEAELAWLQGPRTARLTRAIEAVSPQTAASWSLAEAQSALQLAEAQEPTGEGPLAQARRAVYDLEIELWRQRVEALRQVEPTEVVEQEVEQAEAARQRAERAAQEAQDAASMRVAGVLESLATAQERKSQRREQAVAERDPQLTAELARLKRETQRVFSKIGVHRPAAGTVYVDLRKLLQRLRKDARLQSGRAQAVERVLIESQLRAEAERAQIVAERDTLEAITDVSARAEVSEAVEQWSRVVTQDLRLARQDLKRVRAQRDGALRDLATARQLRHRLDPRVPGELRRRYLVEDVQQEVNLGMPILVAQQRDQAQSVTTLPGRMLRDGNLFQQVVFGVGFVAVLVLGWWFSRRSVTTFAGLLLRWSRRLGWAVRPVELVALKAPLIATLGPLVDLLFGVLLLGQARRAFVLAGLALLTYLQLALYRFLLASYELAVVAHPETRPALRVLHPTSWALVRRTLRAALLWWIARRFSGYLLIDVLQMDTLGVLVGQLFFWLGVGLLAWMLHIWEPAIRRSMARRDGSNAAVAWLATESPPALRALKSALGITLIGATLALDLLHQLASRAEGVARLMNVVSRYQLSQREEEATPVVPLSPDLCATICAPVVPGGGYVRRGDTERLLLQAYEQWAAEGRRGLVAFVGHRGEGKGTTLDHFVAQLQQRKVSPLRVRFEQRTATTKGMLAWLAAHFGLDEVPDSADAAVAALREIPSQVLVVQGAQLSFLRAVGGFHGLRTLLYVCNGASDKHFVVLTFHEPSWDFLSRLGSLINTGVFREVIALQAMGEAEVRQLLQSRLAVAGLTPDFSGLVRPHLLGGDPGVELERTTTVFYRLLAEASGGNPRVALWMASQCLSRGAEPGTVAVHMQDVLATTILDTATDVDLFLLAALYTQDVLDEDELVEVTNMAPGLVRSAVKHLEQLDLLQREGGRVTIAFKALPKVVRTLRRRRFLSWAA